MASQNRKSVGKAGANKSVKQLPAKLASKTAAQRLIEAKAEAQRRMAAKATVAKKSTNTVAAKTENKLHSKPAATATKISSKRIAERQAAQARRVKPEARAAVAPVKPSTIARRPIDPLTQFVNAAAAGNQAEVRRMLKDDAGLAHTWEGIHAAAAHGRAGVVRWLLDAGADANIASTETPMTRPLHVAVQPTPSVPRTAGHVETVDALLLGGGDVRLRGTAANVTPITLAALEGQEQFLSRLLPYCDAWDIFTAAAMGRADVVRMMLRRDPARARTVDVNGMTALHYCCASGLKRDEQIAQRLRETAEALIQSGCDTNARDAQRRTPRDLALAAGRTDLVELLARNASVRAAA